MNLKSLTIVNRSIGGSVLAMTMAGTIVTSPNPASAVTITYEQPNVFSANTAIVGATAENTFESLTAGQQYSTSSFGFVDADTGNNYTANYANLSVANYGNNSQTAGAGFSGNFATNFVADTPTTTITFTDVTTGNTNAGINYFGLFFSSLDSGNQLTFYNGNNVVAQVSINNFDTLVGNNSASFRSNGPYQPEPSAFFNFYADAGEQFTKIEFSAVSGGGGFENDNHTFRVPNAVGISGSGVNLAGLNFSGNVNSTAVPEPFTIIGTIVGGMAALRMRKTLKTRK